MRFFAVLIFVILTIVPCYARIAPTVSGVAVSAHWHGGFNSEYGEFGQIMKYVITSGTTTSSSVLYDGPARYATLSSDGQNVAFLKSNKSIAIISVNGGTPVEIVTGRTGDGGCIDWPTGNWLYYNLAGAGSDDSKSVWKINVSTLEKVQVCTFDCRVWTFQTALDATRFSVRSDDGSSGVCRFALPAGSVPAVSLASSSSNYYCGGCGTSTSPAGQWIMWLEGTSHDKLGFCTWDIRQGQAGWPAQLIILRTMCQWAGTPFVDTIPRQAPYFNHTGGATDNNRWSVNSEKWICLRAGWGSRGGGSGGNQVLVNWVDSQVVRTSNNPDAMYFDTGWQNEAGDFWIGDPGTVQIGRAHV
jgi:hypothetical protein